MHWNNMFIQAHFARKGLGAIITGIFASWTEIIYLFELTLREKALAQNSQLYFLLELKQYVYMRSLSVKRPWRNNNSYICSMHWNNVYSNFLSSSRSTWYFYRQVVDNLNHRPLCQCSSSWTCRRYFYSLPTEDSSMLTSEESEF